MKKITLFFLMLCTCSFLIVSSCSSGEGDTQTDKTTEAASDTGEKVEAADAEAVDANADDYLGNWSYSIKGTPLGDFEGTLSFSKTDDGYAGIIMLSDDSSPLEDFKLEGNKFEGNLMYEGNPVKLSGSMKGNSMIGKASSMGFDFNIEGTKE